MYGAKTRMTGRVELDFDLSITTAHTPNVTLMFARAGDIDEEARRLGASELSSANVDEMFPRGNGDWSLNAGGDVDPQYAARAAVIATTAGSASTSAYRDCASHVSVITARSWSVQL